MALVARHTQRISISGKYLHFTLSVLLREVRMQNQIVKDENLMIHTEFRTYLKAN